MSDLLALPLCVIACYAYTAQDEALATQHMTTTTTRCSERWSSCRCLSLLSYDQAIYASNVDFEQVSHPPRCSKWWSTMYIHQ